MNLKCTFLDCDTKMFTREKRYKVVNIINSLYEIIDDLGYTRYVMDGKFIIGSVRMGRSLSFPEIPQYAHFSLDNQ